MNVPIHKSNGAFNLLEVVIASFLFSIISVAFLGVWGMQVRAAEKSRHNLVATLLAEQMIEEVMEQGYELTKVSTGTDPVLEPILIEMELQGADGAWGKVNVAYQPHVEVVEFGAGSDKLKQVTVRVSWEDTTKTGEVVLETYLAGVF